MSQNRPGCFLLGSLRVGSIAGIPIRLHFTFILIVGWLMFAAFQLPELRVLAFLLPAIFVCVLLHELGHALVAQRYGVRIRDITLYPIGGVAMFQDRPRPYQEFWIALAGPAVNVVIAIIILPFLLALHGGLPPLTLYIGELTFLEGLFMANILLPLFNMIPAFPMDGGRVLRAALAKWMPEAKATQIAATIGQVLAIGGVFAGLMIPNLFLIIIAFFVFLAAGSEVQAMAGLSLVADRRVRDAMMTDFKVIGNGETLGRASQMLLEGSQQDFPVVWGTEVTGLLTREDLINGLAQAGPNDYVAGHMRREYKKMHPDDPLEDALQSFSADRAPVVVMVGEGLVGLLTTENLAEFMMLRQARQAR